MTRASAEAVDRLEQVFAAILAEVRRNPALSQDLENILSGLTKSPKQSDRRSHRRSPGVLDPFQILGASSMEELGRRLSELGVEELKDIVAEHGMDRAKLAMKWKSSDRLVKLIVETVEARAKKGHAFR